MLLNINDPAALTVVIAACFMCMAMFFAIFYLIAKRPKRTHLSLQFYQRYHVLCNEIIRAKVSMDISILENVKRRIELDHEFTHHMAKEIKAGLMEDILEAKIYISTAPKVPDYKFLDN